MQIQVSLEGSTRSEKKINRSYSTVCYPRPCCYLSQVIDSNCLLTNQSINIWAEYNKCMRGKFSLSYWWLLLKVFKKHKFNGFILYFPSKLTERRNLKSISKICSFDQTFCASSETKESMVSRFNKLLSFKSNQILQIQPCSQSSFARNRMWGHPSSWFIDSCYCIQPQVPLFPRLHCWGLGRSCCR